ncbi:aminopeptidase N-like [Ochlerotatus camptorhynchus]|uniref:aminopeptidase N-like n=1 Tax=Ochlerotatus camptorhynchus TaxID=644619 RepID=UPI0031E00E6D
MKWKTFYLTVAILASMSICKAFESFRLPNSTIPTHYDLFIDTEIHNDNLDYNGTVKISINVLEDTKQIILHSSRSTLVELVLKDDNQLPITVINHEFEIEKEFLIVHVASALKNGSRVVLEIDFLNSINRTDQAGFYRTSYNDDNGTLKYAGLTQFQACEARSSFPCYDEPGIKATFDVRITCGVDYHARSNAEIASVAILPAGKKLVTFQRTPPMQTYLLAFLVSDFAVKRDLANSTKKITVQSMVRPTHADQLLFSLDASVKLIDELQKYFDHPYELSKIDSVGIRNNDFAAGAMENWGLVTYLEAYFLISDSSNDNNRRSVTTVIAHEFAHQFFGNLLAPKWWSYLWLNEGFATLYEYYLSDRTHPELKIKQLFSSGALQSALQADGSATVRSMTHYVETVPEIDRLFDRIAYDKSGSVLRMMQYALGEQTFLKGLRHYIKQNQNSVVEPQDLFDSLQKAATDDQVLPPDSSMTHILASWSNQPGVPVVSVRRTPGSDDVIFDQKRFFTSAQPPENNQTWWIPIFLYTNSSGGSNEKTSLFWMPQGTKEVTHNIPTQEDDVFLINPAQTGYYRVNYDQQTWKTIAATLKSNPNLIDAISTGQLIDDSMNLAHAGLLDHSTAFQILDHLRNNTQYLPWKSAYRNILQLEKMLTIDPEALDMLRKYLLELTYELYETYGSEKRKVEHTDYYDAQLIAIDLSCRIGQQECLDQAISKLNILQQRTMLTIRSEAEQRLYCHALRSARQNAVDRFTEALETEENSQGRKYLIESLACVGTRKELDRVMAILVGEIGIKSEMARFLEISAEHGSVGFEAVVDFLTREKDQVDDIFGSKRSMEKLLYNLANRVVDQLNAGRLRQMMKVLQIPADFETIINHQLNEQILWQERNLPLIRQTLQQYTYQ